jgi:hypothetical protein
MTTRNNAPTTRGRPFQRGNPGRPHGARHKTTLAVQALLDGEAEGLTRSAIERAMAGDTTALRLCLDRIAPPPKDRPVSLELPPLSGPADVPAAIAAMLAAVARGELSPSEGAHLAALLERYQAACDLGGLETRIEALEARK